MTNDVRQVIEDYEKAYLEANGKPVKVTYRGGWFIIGDGSADKYRKKDILAFIEVLTGRLPKQREIPNTLQIGLYIHCGKCLKEMPAGTSPKEWNRLQVGWTPMGLQVWCVRHNCNVMHIDLEGQMHPANTTCAA
jgi:hypothetical protein